MSAAVRMDRLRSSTDVCVKLMQAPLPALPYAMSWSESFDKVIEEASHDDLCPAARQPEPDQILHHPRADGRLRKQPPELESSRAIQDTLKIERHSPFLPRPRPLARRTPEYPSCDSSLIIAKLSISAASAM